MTHLDRFQRRSMHNHRTPGPVSGDIHSPSSPSRPACPRGAAPVPYSYDLCYLHHLATAALGRARLTGQRQLWRAEIRNTTPRFFVDWQERYFKGKKVWIKVDHLGDPVIESGRVEMRYQQAEDAKVYRAAANNISDQPADLIDATREFEKKLAGKKSASSSKSSSKSAKSGTKPAPGSITSLESPERWGPRHESTQAPSNIAALARPDEGSVEIYTDGACSGNPGPCGYGVVIRDGDAYREIGQYLGQGTNNVGELMGIKTALEAVEDRSRPVHIYTDSTYCIGVLTKGWKAKANRELILEIRELVAKFSNLTFHKVKGHSDHPLNDRADFMATSSLDDAR